MTKTDIGKDVGEMALKTYAQFRGGMKASLTSSFLIFFSLIAVGVKSLGPLTVLPHL